MGLRQKDQTSKKATGTFNRDSLLKYLEKEAMEYKDREDIVPFTGEKKGVCGYLFTTFEKAEHKHEGSHTKYKQICFLDCSSKTETDKQLIF